MPMLRSLHPRQAHWAVRMNWRNRSICFVLLGMTVGCHLWAMQASVWAWALLALQFGLAPQLQYLYGCTAAKPRRAEVHNMLFDAACFGAWGAALGFPLWISFGMWISACMNLIAFGSWKGGSKAVLAIAFGVGAVATVQPLTYQPDTGIWATALCMGTLVLFLGAFAHDGFRRASRLYQQRAQVREQLVQIQSLKDLLAEQATRDPLTGLFNRRMLEQKLPQLMQQCAARHKPLVVMLLDLDRFKAVNDSYGHAAGDQLLLMVSHHLVRYSRPQDLVFRYGGDEFLLIFPETPVQVAHERAQRMCEAFRQLPRTQPDQALRSTLSCGLASYPAHGRDVVTLLQHADEALYCAKAAGRNCVILYGDAPKEVSAPSSAMTA